MKKMTRFAAALLAALMLGSSLASCNVPASRDNPQPAVTDENPTVTTTTPGEETKLPVEIPVSTDTPLTVETASAEIPEALRTLTVNNETAVGGIISANSVFTVTTAAETDAETLRRYLRVTPAAEFDVEGEGTSFTLRPRTILEANTLYRFTVTDTAVPAATLLTPASFAFQTADTPRILSVFPADRAEGVPLKTGIELTFNEVLAAGIDWTKYCSIEPAVPFRTEVYQHGKTLVLIPEQSLELGTAYTVSAPAGLPLASGRVTTEAKVFTFRTETKPVSEDPLSLSMSVRERTGRTDEQISFQFNIYSQSISDVTLDDTVCTLYRFPDAHAAAAALLDFEQNADAYAAAGMEFRFDTAGLKKTDTRKLPAEPMNQYMRYSASYRVTLPALEAGCYVVDVTVSGTEGKQKFTRDCQLLVQSTDIEVSTAGAGEDLVVWLNENGQPLSVPVTAHLYDRYFGWSLRRRTDGDATVRKVTTSSNTDGVAYLETEGRSCALAVIGEGEPARFVCIGGGSVSEIARRVYVYTDREQYYPNDTVRFWGAVTPAEGLTSLRVTSNAADPVTVQVLPDGTFSGSITWGDYAGYGVSLSFEEDGRSIASAYKSITHEDKPVYTASVEMDRLYYRRGDTVTATLTASYFDGTPAGGLRFVWNIDGFGSGSGEVVTDDDGKATVSVKTFTGRVYSTDPQNCGVHFELIGNDASSLYVYSNFLYFHSDLVLDTQRGEDGVTITLNQLDTAALDDGSSYYAVRDRLKGAPAKGSISVKLTRSWSERIVTGSRYDPITKKSVDITRTEWKEETVRSYTASFENGTLTLPYVENPEANSNYNYQFTFRDGSYTYTYHQSARKWEVYQTGEAQPQYKLTAARADGSAAAENEYSSYAYVSPDEKITFAVTYGDKPVKDGRTLFVYMTPRGVSSVRLGKDHGDTAVFDASLMPYARVAALTVDERTTVSSLTFDLQYNYPALSTLSVTLTPEKDKCLPGETVHVTAQVKDAAGAPVPDARVLLSLVDEANFAQREQNLTTEGVLSRIVQFYPIGSAVQQRYFVLSGGGRLYAAYDDVAEMETMPETTAAAMYAAPMAPNKSMAAATGGAAGDSASSVYVRENFADNPYFTPLTTDRDGVAVFEVAIPDNITTWRLSAVAVSRDEQAGAPIDLSAGTAKDAVICSQPFFISASVGDLYLSGDDISFTARYSGAEDCGTASYTAVLENSAEAVLAESGSEAGRNKTVFFNMGKVPAGEYFVRITARAGEKADAVRYPITVVDSAILVPVNRVLEAGELSSVTPSLYPLTLTFFDGSHTLVSRAVSEILSSQNGRTDTKAAALAAYRILGDLYGASSLYADRIADLLDEVNTTGGARIYSYAEADPVLTAKISLLLSDVLSYSTRQSFVSYLTDTLVSTGEAKIAAASLLGLVSLNQPVLGDLHFVRENFDSFKNADTEAKLYLAAAFAAAGDAASASDLYIEAVSGVRMQGFYLEGETMEETLALTNAALLCASLIDPTEAEGLMGYLLQRSSSYEMYVLEKAIFAAAYAPESYEEKSFTYTLNGETVTRTLTGRCPVTLHLNRDSFASFALTDAHADIRVRAQYVGTPDEAAVSEMENVKVKKTVEPSSEGTDFYRVTVEITGTTDKDWFSANLTDRIPTGARFVRIMGQSFNGSSDTWGWIREENGHVRGSLSVYNRNVATTAGRSEKSFTATYSYLIRAYTPGEFVCESTYLVENGSGNYARSQRFEMKFD